MHFVQIRFVFVESKPQYTIQSVLYTSTYCICVIFYYWLASQAVRSKIVDIPLNYIIRVGSTFASIKKKDLYSSAKTIGETIFTLSINGTNKMQKTEILK